jgi:murein DD-endopeptidase MepM/ murein hydrolase activator NlpD
MSKGGRKKFLHKFKHKYRFVILREDSLEEKASFKLSRLNVLMIVSMLAILLSALVFFLIAYTPLKIYVPGYTDYSMRKDIIEVSVKADSLEHELELKEKYLQNIRNILQGDVQQYAKTSDKKLDSVPITSDADLFKISKDDSLFRKQVEDEDQFNLLYQETTSEDNILKNTAFFPPVNGVITEKFDRDKGHFGVDFAAPQDVGIKATLDGMVVEASWNISTGYVIIIQHKNNLISIYKHNSVLLKKIGKFVRAGEVIAIIGETGEFSHGPHLHFELWYEGNPLNPEEYVAF